jgi:hypothetical protein
MNRSKQLKSELTTIKRQLHAARTKPPRENPVIRGFVAGFCDEAPRFLTSAESASRSLDMEPPAGMPSLAKLSLAYGISRQRLGQLSRTHGREVVHDPDLLFAAILTTCNSVLMRLADPGERARIKGELSKITP